MSFFWAGRVFFFSGDGIFWGKCFSRDGELEGSRLENYEDEDEPMVFVSVGRWLLRSWVVLRERERFENNNFILWVLFWVRVGFMEGKGGEEEGEVLGKR